MPVGQNVSWICAEGSVFKDEPFLKPSLNLTCQADGTFNLPKEWPVCMPGMSACKYITTVTYHRFIPPPQKQEL